MIPISVSKQTVTTPDRGLREYGVPGDPAGYVGAAGIHFQNTFVGVAYIAGIPQATADAGTGAAYLSLIHGGLGSDSPNQFSEVALPAPAQLAVPAFPNPEVTGYYNTGPNVGNALTNGFLNTEKLRRSRSDAQGGANDGTTWSILDGRRRLIFSLWLHSQGSPASDIFMLEVYRDLNNQDKGGGGWGGLTTDVTNAQLIYQFGPFQSAPNVINRHANCQVAEPVDLPAGCNLYIIARNISDPAAINNIIGSVRLVP